MDKFVAFADSFWICPFTELMSEYDKFKNMEPNQRQSYLFFWVNVINISQILVKFKLDIKLNHYLD